MNNSYENEKSKIVNAAMFIDALKNSGYKSTDNAIAEIVDNSIDADADDIFIIGEQSIAGNGERRIVSFAFLDNGKGMDYLTLKDCLTIGYTTNQERKGMGRFGVGLPQASIFVCDRVEVYSWQNGIENCKRVHLDSDEVKERNLNEIAEPITTNFPTKYEKYLEWRGIDKTFNFKQHGTLVVWTKCTTVDYKKWNTCVNHLSADLGRKYRYFLANEDKRIHMLELISDSDEIMLPNDPLYLMTPSQECAPADVQQFIDGNYETRKYNVSTGYTEPLFEIFKSDPDAEDVVKLNIKYEENDEIKIGQVKIKYSVIKEKYYSKTSLKTETKPGSLSFGKSARLNENVGISIVRNGREIDFGSFGFFDFYNVPEYRWWGIEISFGSDLDSAFGISNNKQSVNIKAMSKQEMSEVASDELKTVWHQLAEEILDTIKAMDKRNSAIRGMEMVVDNSQPGEASEISNKSDEAEGLLQEEPDMPDEQKQEEAEEQLIAEGNDEPTENQKQQLIDSKIRVVVVHNKTKRDSFVDYSFAAGTLSIIINANHDFYDILVKKLMENEDSKVPFELFVMAVMKSIKDLNLEYSDAMDKLMDRINRRISNYIMEYIKTNG